MATFSGSGSEGLLPRLGRLRYFFTHALVASSHFISFIFSQSAFVVVAVHHTLRRPKSEPWRRGANSDPLLKRTPMPSAPFQTTVAWRLTPEKVSASSNVFGNQSAFAINTIAPLRDTLEILQGRLRFLPSIIVAGRLTDCRGSFRSMAFCSRWNGLTGNNAKADWVKEKCIPPGRPGIQEPLHSPRTITLRHGKQPRTSEASSFYVLRFPNWNRVRTSVHEGPSRDC